MEPARQLDGGGIAMEIVEEEDAGATRLGRLSLSLDLNGGGGGAFRPSTLLDEYERLAIEAQLDRAVLRRSYSEPSPSRLAVVAPQDKQEAPPGAAGRRAKEEEKPGAGRAPARRSWLLEALKRLLCWLGIGGAWGGGRRRGEEPAAPCPPAPPPRMQLLDYLTTTSTT
ncbi:hypothetical protein [Oryza sativa Japonica Group]|jgi:hypothetical protein|uniref:Uncharacterized protein n=5 Tax=Oryza TaxID=4527 RepID=A0A0P0V9N7_ORYSJ|nr:hypothetical protein DAI22_01g381600 [Oryza sativa Japonica Group]BAB85308.1 hypothetical protein [Oryza sativa Japonica Group]BAB86489.1 hypothetical protein [Oryza sativa Japonica Group]BAS74980.1 Os01g0822100 [Oryza sativa Japonica Group]